MKNTILLIGLVSLPIIFDYFFHKHWKKRWLRYSQIGVHHSTTAMKTFWGVPALISVLSLITMGLIILWHVVKPDYTVHWIGWVFASGIILLGLKDAITLTSNFFTIKNGPSIEAGLYQYETQVIKNGETLKNTCYICEKNGHRREMVLSDKPGFNHFIRFFNNDPSKRWSPTQGCFQCANCGRLVCYTHSDGSMVCDCGVCDWKEHSYVQQELDHGETITSTHTQTEQQRSDETNNSGLEAFAKGLMNNDFGLIEQGIKAGVDVNMLFGEGGFTTPLIFSAHRGNHYVCKKLLEAGADPNQRNKRGHLALCEVLANPKLPIENRLKISKLLLEHGADPNALDWGRPALHFSLDSPKLVETMLALGADVNRASEYHELAAPRQGQHFEYQENALRWYCKLIVSAPAPNHERVIKTLLTAGADPLQPNSEGYTAWDFVNNFLMKGPVNAQVPGPLGAIFRKRRERYIQSRIKEFEKLADLFRPIVESAKYDLFVSYAAGSGWGEFFRGRLEKTRKRIWYSELLKRTLPHYEEVMRAHINHAPAAVVFLSPDHFMADNRVKKERSRELQALLDRFRSIPEKLLLVSTGESVPQLIDQHPELKGFEVFQLNETSVNDLWQRINCLSPLPPSCQQNIFYDLLNIKDHVYDCFISYRSVSVNTVRFVAEQLVARGVKPWFAEWEILVSGRRGFQESINRGLAASKTALCCTNSGYAASEYCRIEAMQILDVPGKEHRNILELRMPDEANAISNALQSHGSKSVVVAESSLQESWRQCCEFLGIKSEELPERDTGGQTLRLEMDNSTFTLNISREWSVTIFNKQMGFGNVAIAGFTRKMDGICLECVLNAGPWAITLPEDAQSDDRAMFEAIVSTLRGWNREGKIFYPKGVHVVHVPALHTAKQRVGHPAFTYLDPDRDDYVGRQVPIEKCVWHRKYSIRVGAPHMPSDMEFCFDFDIRGVAHDDFATFCRYAYMMDDLVRGLKFGGTK